MRNVQMVLALNEFKLIIYMEKKYKQLTPSTPNKKKIKEEKNMCSNQFTTEELFYFVLSFKT